MSNGYFLGKLINRLEGKEDLIKGLEQDHKNISRLRNNWTKVLEFLKKKSKFVYNLLFEIEEFLKENSIMLPNQDRDELPVTTAVFHYEIANVHTSSRNDSEIIKEMY